MNDDPFSVEADPYPPPAVAVAVGRRELLLGAALLGPAVTGCIAVRRLGCAPRPEQPEGCRHRFCRYYSARSSGGKPANPSSAGT